MHTYSLSSSPHRQEHLLRHRAADLDPGHEPQTIGEAMAEAGLSAEQIEAVESVIEAEAERLSFHRSAEVLREVFARVSTVSTAGAALAFALGLAENKSLVELGAQFSTSKQSVGNAVRRLAPLLNGLAVSRAGERPTEPGKWFSLAEAAKHTGRSATAIQAAAQAGTLRRLFVGNRGYFEEAELTRWSDELTLRLVTQTCTQQKHPPQPNTNPAPQSVSCSA